MSQSRKSQIVSYMYELEYKITDGDMKAVNKSIMWRYFVPYLTVSLVGIGVGILAAVMRPRIELMICGIILAVFGWILLVCSVLMAVAPKNFVASILETYDDVVRKVTVDERCVKIAIEGQSDITIPLGDITAVKTRKDCLLLYFGKQRVLIVKNAFKTGQSLGELRDFILGNRMSPKAAFVPSEKDGEAKDGCTADGE